MKIIKEKSCGIIPFMIVDGDIKFLIVKHNLGHWGFPKGHIEKGETEEQTAKRELLEETGIDNVKLVNNYKFTDNYVTTINGKKSKKTVMYFLGRICIDNDNKINILTSELCDYLIDSYDNVMKLITYDSSKQNLKKTFIYLTHNTDG